MKASQQTIQQIERSLRKIAAKFPQGDDALLTDIHLLVNPYTGEIRAYNDDCLVANGGGSFENHLVSLYEKSF